MTVTQDPPVDEKGQSIAGMAENGGAPDEPQEPMLQGTGEQLSLTGIGGSTPAQSTVRLDGGQFGVHGQFKIGDKLIVRVYDVDGAELGNRVLSVEKVEFDRKGGSVTTRRHIARPEE